MSFKPTPQQKAAINAPHNHSAIVTAAAGSGKTTLLVDRILRLLSEPSLNIRGDSLAILTFTRNAASSLRAKLISKMTERIKALSSDFSTEASALRMLLTEQMVALRSASIGTIDSFCINVIKENAQAFGLPLNFSIADDARVFSMKALSMKRTMSCFYNSEDEENGISAQEREVLFHTFSFENDTQLQEELLKAFERMSSFADREDWLKKCEEIYSDFDIMFAHYADSYVAAIKKIIDKNAPAVKRLSDVCAAYKSDAEEEADPKKALKKQAVLESMEQYTATAQKLFSDKEKQLNELIKQPEIGAIVRFFGDLDKYVFEKINGADPQNPTKKHFTQVRKSFTLPDELSAIAINEAQERMMFSQQKTAVTAFIKLLRNFTETYRSIMHANGALDFAECEYLLLERLRSDPALCEHLSERFSCVIVDEFQDSNDIQAEIFKLISNGKSNLFYVGDVKQAIYAFRGGNPAIMGALCDKPKRLARPAKGIARFSKEKAERHIAENCFTVLPLNRNFRSRKNVIDFVNEMFTGVMTRKYGGIDYNEAAALTLGSDKVYREIPEDKKKDYNTEIHLLSYGKATDSELSAAQQEAAFTAGRIAELYEAGALVSDGGELRPCRYSDFTVLLRSNTHIAEYREALKSLGIPATMAKNNQFLAAEEIRLILDLLTVIDNPMKDESMLRVIMSPLFGFTAEEVAEIRLGILGLPDEALKSDIYPIVRLNSKRTLYGCMTYCARTENPEDMHTKNISAEQSENSKAALECLKKLSEKNITRQVGEKLRGFLDMLKRFRVVMGYSTLDELIRYVYEETEMYNIIATYENSRQRLANIRLLRKYAADFTEAQGGGLNDFLRFIAQMGEDTLSAANLPEVNANAVNIMTFHASKGLEMPICIIAGFGSRCNTSDAGGTLLLNHSDGIALQYVDIRERYTAQTFAYKSLRGILLDNIYSEELRLLYVAFTRAIDKLILIGSDSGEISDYILPEDASADKVLCDYTPIKWTLRSLLRGVPHSVGEYFSSTEEDTAHISISCGTDLFVHKTAAGALNCAEQEQHDEIAADENAVKQVVAYLKMKYPYLAETQMLAKYTVTELAHKDDDSVYTGIFLNPPEFDSERTPTGKEIGDAYHHYMEHCPLEEIKHCSRENLQELTEKIILRLGAEKKLTEREVMILTSKKKRIDNICSFFTSKLGQLMLSDTTKVVREFELLAPLPASELGISAEGTESDVQIPVQGRTDMFFYTDKGIVLVDYKSDTRANLEKELLNYCTQLQIYKKLLPANQKEKVYKIFIYCFSENGITIDVDEYLAKAQGTKK